MSPAVGGAPGNILAFDYGLRRIGVAVGESATGSSSPLASVRVTRRGPDWETIGRLLDEWRPVLALVGVPRLPDGGEGSFAPAARGFARALGERFGVAVETADETLTSREARDLLREQRRSGTRTRRLRRADVDPVAAVLILRGWLESRERA